MWEDTLCVYYRGYDSFDGLELIASDKLKIMDCHFLKEITKRSEGIGMEWTKYKNVIVFTLKDMNVTKKKFTIGSTNGLLERVALIWLYVFNAIFWHCLGGILFDGRFRFIKSRIVFPNDETNWSIFLLKMRGRKQTFLSFILRTITYFLD